MYYERIKQIRLMRGVTQSQIADHLGTSQQTYSKYENGIHEMSAVKIIAICKYLNISADYIFGFSNEPKELY